MSPLAETWLTEQVSVFSYGGETLATSYGANAVAFFGEGAIVRRALESGTEEDARASLTRAFPLFRLGIVLPALVARFR